MSHVILRDLYSLIYHGTESKYWCKLHNATNYLKK